MSDSFATRALADTDRSWVHSDTYATRVDTEIDQLVERARDIATSVLERSRDRLEAMTDVLIERETLERHEFEAVMRGETLPAPVVEAEEESADESPLQETASVSVMTEQSVVETEPTPDMTDRAAPVDTDGHVAGADDDQLPAAA